jgi:CubicO group peptidase (beta-lactamase class C family)
VTAAGRSGVAPRANGTLTPRAYDVRGSAKVRHLLHHTSGIRDYLTLMSLAGMDDHDDYSYQELVDLLARQHHLDFTPGDEHLYSNSGYVLLAVIVERATDRFSGTLTRAQAGTITGLVVDSGRVKGLRFVRR